MTETSMPTASPTAPPTASPTAPSGSAWTVQTLVSTSLYWTIQLTCLLVLVVETGPLEVGLCLGLFWTRLFGITGVYHRYFAHKTYRTSRAFQLLLALLGCAAVQKGPLWWAAGHRRHHRFSDQEGDLHSPRQGFWHAHQGWIFDERWSDTEMGRIRDFAAHPELVWLDRWHALPPLVLALICFALGGLSTLVWGFCVSTTLLWHATYSINSLAHRWGTQRYDTGDDSRNNWVLALLTMGEGWHNNHHHYMASARQGFFWWELDFTYYILRGLQALGLVWDIREPPARVLQGHRSDSPASDRMAA